MLDRSRMREAPRPTIPVSALMAKGYSGSRLWPDHARESRTRTVTARLSKLLRI